MVRYCTEHKIMEGHMKCWGNFQFEIILLERVSRKVIFEQRIKGDTDMGSVDICEKWLLGWPKDKEVWGHNTIWLEYSRQMGVSE